MSGMGEIARVDNVGIDDNKDCMSTMKILCRQYRLENTQIGNVVCCH